jgi:hypothetical protein
MTGRMVTDAGALDRKRDESESTTTEPGAPTDEPFASLLRRSVRPVDLLALLVVPAVLVAGALLPAETRLELAFSYTDPTLPTAFKSAFVHVGPDHLLFNLATYAFVVPTVYLLSVLAGDRDRFYVAFVSFLVVFPVVLSFLNLAVPRDGVSLGFSGVNMAFVGYLPVALAGYLRRHFGVTDEYDAASGLFFAGLVLVAVLVVRMPLTEAVAAVAAVAALVHLRSAAGGLPRSLPALGPAGYAELGAVAVLLLAGGLVGGFPPDLTAGGAVVNVYVHFLGYALGFVATYVTFRVAPVVERSPLVAAVRDLTVAVLPGLTAGS